MAQCGFCGKECTLVRKESEKLVEYRCSECDAPLEVYLAEMEERLKEIYSHSTARKEGRQ